MEYTIKFSLQAYRKIRLANGYSANEVGFFGITEKDNCLIVNDVYMPIQTVGIASCSFDDEDVSRYFAEYAEKDYLPRQLSRVWIHTHPANNLTPSGTDNTTFNQVLGIQDLGVMVICEKNGNMKAWLQVNNLAGLSKPVRIEIATSIDFLSDCNFREVDFKSEFDEKVKRYIYGNLSTGHKNSSYGGYWENGRYVWPDQVSKRKGQDIDSVYGRNFLNSGNSKQPTESDNLTALDFCDTCKKPLKKETHYAQCEVCLEAICRCKHCSNINTARKIMNLCDSCDREDDLTNPNRQKYDEDLGFYV